MKCPFTDIGCWWIDDVSHDCEAEKRSYCPHDLAYDPNPKQSQKKEDGEE